MLAAVIAVSSLPHAAHAAEPSCDCQQSAGTCSASIAVKPVEATTLGSYASELRFTSSAPACSKVNYHVDGTPYFNVLVNGNTGADTIWGQKQISRANITEISCQVCKQVAMTPAPVEKKPENIELKPTLFDGLWRRRWRPLLGFAVLCAGVLGWWSTLKPSHDRVWADDVARLLHIDIDGNHARLTNVRNFDWRSETDYTVRWETRDYDLDHLVTADLVLSYWMGPAIAHTLVSFGFDDGRYLTFSVEIRKEKGESFSALGGFFRKFETVLVASDERDIVRVRSNVRGEDVYVYRLQVEPATLRKLFVGYAGEAARLEREPAFYNTLTSNCTTIVFDLARAINPQLPFDYRLLASGYLAEYAHDVGGLTPGFDYAALHARGRITERALAAGNDARFSELIRVGIPGIPGTPAPAK